MTRIKMVEIDRYFAALSRDKRKSGSLLRKGREVCIFPAPTLKRQIRAERTNVPTSGTMKARKMHHTQATISTSGRSTRQDRPIPAGEVGAALWRSTTSRYLARWRERKYIFNYKIGIITASKSLSFPISRIRSAGKVKFVNKRFLENH